MDPTSTTLGRPPRRPRRGDFIRYQVPGGSIRAKVLTAHLDGACTVEPWFFIRPDGTEVPGIIGGKVAVFASEIIAGAAS